MSIARTPAVLMSMGVLVACGGTGAAPPMNVYVPDRTDVPTEGDGRLNGSFESAQGFGWDTCFTRTPGLVASTAGTAPSPTSGSYYFRFEADQSCSGTCAANRPEAQLAFYFDAPLASAVPLHLYFDAVAIGDNGAGTLHLDQVNSTCETLAPLATIELGDLALTSSWQTRCVSFTPSSDLTVLGLYVKGTSFHVALDALRLGPPCHKG